MVVNYSAIELGNILSDTTKTLSDTKQTYIESEDTADLNLTMLDTINLTGSYVIKKYTYAPDSFIIDHPVYGYIDSPTLKIDGGYAQALTWTYLTFPITFTATFVVTSIEGSSIMTSGLI